MAMKKLLDLEDKPQPGKQKPGYTGVGARVQAIKASIQQSHLSLELTLYQLVK
jgi:hypothetical protein